MRQGGWIKPPHDFVKLNVDASFDADDLRGTSGAVLRDCHGSFLAAGSRKLDFVFDVFSAEILAMKHGLELAQSVGCNRVICCSDSTDVINALQEGGYSNGAAAATLDDCYHLAREFPKIQFEHNFREANSVAHEIARYTKSNEQQVWLDEPPNFIIPFLVNDVKLIMNK